MISFLSPLSLAALAPFALFALWMLVGRRKREWVSFLPLWDAPEEIRRPKKGFEPPPLALILALLALLGGLLAMAQPRIWPRGVVDRGRITILVDRGASMSAVVGGKARYAALAEQVAPILLDRFGPGTIELVDLASGRVLQSDRSDWSRIVKQWGRTAMDTSALLKTSIEQHVERGEPVIVISDKDLKESSDQVVQIKPITTVHDAGIVALAVRPGQLMITFRATDAMTRRLVIRSGDQSVQREVDLPAAAQTRLFIDFNTSGDVIEAALDPDAADQFDGNDRAWLVRQRSWPKIEPQTPLGDELRRAIEVYQRHRAAGEASARIVIARPGDLKSEQPGVALASINRPESAGGAVMARPHPLLTGVTDWGPLSKGVAAATTPPGVGWTPLLTAGGKTLVAVKEGDVRQVWVGFESRAFARTPGFVIFWTSVLDWLGGGAEGFASQPVSPLEEDMKRLQPSQIPGDADGALWPGVIDQAGDRVAMNAAEVSFGSDPAGDWKGALRRLRLAPRSGIDLAPWLAIFSLVCLLGSAGRWESSRRLRNSASSQIRG